MAAARRSPAKTNLFLRITRKREDGFHELASVFQVTACMACALAGAAPPRRSARVTVPTRDPRAKQALGLGDTLEISKLDGGTQDVLSCNVKEVPLDGKNLIVKAFDLFRQRTGTTAALSPASAPHTAPSE